MKSKHRRKPFMNTMFHKLCSPQIFASCMVAECWIGIVYVLVAHGNSDSELKPASRCVAPETISTGSPARTSVAVKPVHLSLNLNHSVDWELVKVLSEMDIRNPSPEHEAFLREYKTTKIE